MRRGRRLASDHLVLHYLTRSEQVPARAGFVVGKVAGNSVQRHRLIRQLRHLVVAELAAMPMGTELVVRAAGACDDPSSELMHLLTKAGLRA